MLTYQPPSPFSCHPAAERSAAEGSAVAEDLEAAEELNRAFPLFIRAERWATGANADPSATLRDDKKGEGSG